MQKTRLPPRGLSRLLVARAIGGPPHSGRLLAGGLVLRCALGRSGVVAFKREGDGATPRGRMALTKILYRPGRVIRAGLVVPAQALRRTDIWCDDAGSASYNRFLRGPARLGHEDLWRADALYDALGVLDYNLTPPVRGRGSAIFFHLASPDYGATAGCVALSARDMARLLPRLARRAALIVS
jgi:L,D-peptidoglycan transpeptidase YkuD (ErfK/YbiS/YcfS/YnhG family)